MLGDGDIPLNLARRLSARESYVVLISTGSAAVEELSGISRVFLNGDEAQALAEAGLAEAKMLVAVSHDEGINLAACRVAKAEHGVERCISMVNHGQTRDELLRLGVETIEPTTALIVALDNLVNRPSAFALFSGTGSGKVAGEVHLQNSELAGRALRNVQLPGDCLVALVKRSTELFVPNGNTVLKMGDQLTFLGERDVVDQVMEMFVSGSARVPQRARGVGSHPD